ncbi:MAG: DUF3857 domain-containing protein [Candidatus Zixiibacteriota bacterium]|nr:MAG: DUF3857 domain-containing protein [candidate division Zixibacteria bacterium]
MLSLLYRKAIALTTILFLLSCAISWADDSWVEKLPEDWIRSLPAEDHIPLSSDYPSAGAVYLLDEEIYYVADKTRVRVVIMRIFNRRGYKYAEVTTPYYRKNESVEVRGRTRRKDGTMVILDREDIHEILTSKDLKRKKFTLPAIEDDCLIQYEIVHRSGRHTVSGIRYFQSDEPTLLSRFNLIVPKHLKVIHFDSPPGILDTTKEKPTNSEKVALYAFAKRNLLPYETEAFMPPLFHYSPSLAFVITVPQEEELGASWENVSRRYFETMHTHFAPTGNMKKLAKRFTEEVTGEKEKVEKIFYFVQSHFKTDFASRSIFDQAQTIFNRQGGSSAEVTGLIYALLRSVEIESTPVLVPNRKIVIDLPDVPMLDWFSHLLLRVTADGEELWLDLLHQANGVNHISPEYRGVDGLLVQESDGKLDRIPSLDCSENLRRSITDVSLKADGSIDCESREIYSPERSAGIKDHLRSETILEREDKMAKRIREYCPGAVLDSCRFGDLYAFGGDFELHCRFHSSHYVQNADDFLYLNPNLLNRDETAKDFGQPVRIFPIMFDQVKTDVDSVVTNLPSPYEVTGLPAPVHLENDFGEFRIEYKISGSQLVYKRLLKIKKLLVPQGEYKEVKRFFNRIFEEDQKPIEIKRKE